MILWLSNLSETEKWLTGILSVFVSGFFFQWLNHTLAIRRENRARRLAACANFRAAVMAELGSIYPNASDWPTSFSIDRFLRSHFIALQTAVENFKPFVPWWKRWLFERAWFRYRCSTGRKIDIECYHHYMSFSSNPNYKDNFRENVSRLLSFAKET